MADRVSNLEASALSETTKACARVHGALCPRILMSQYSRDGHAVACSLGHVVPIEPAELADCVVWMSDNNMGMR